MAAEAPDGHSGNLGRLEVGQKMAWLGAEKEHLKENECLFFLVLEKGVDNIFYFIHAWANCSSCPLEQLLQSVLT